MDRVLGKKETTMTLNKNEEKVLSIIDGDTFQTAKGPIRLEGVNAPKIRTEAGKKAKKSLEDLIAGKIVAVDVIRYNYGRRVAEVKVARWSINRAMIKKIEIFKTSPIIPSQIPSQML